MQFSDVVSQRKSVRSFLDKKVPQELIKKIIEVATHAPTSCNQQLWHFVIIEDKDLKERLIKEAASSTLIRRAPVIIVVSYDGWQYKEAIQNSSLAMGHIILAATEYGLGTLPINSYGAETKIKKILNMPKSQLICCFVLLGYPDEKAIASPSVLRRDVREVIHWNFFSSNRQNLYPYNPENWSKKHLVDHQRFFCRKTFLGKEMDIVSEIEKKLVRQILKNIKNPIVDFLSYDGTYIREFPDELDIATIDLSKETADYTQAAATTANKKIKCQLLDSTLEPSKKISTLIFKAERIPFSIRHRIYEKIDGEFIIIARKSNIFLRVLFFGLKHSLGPDIRKAGIFSFFGPYEPLNLRKILKELKQAGFKNIKWEGYFFLPAFFEQIYQMFIQYRISGGSSFLHRERRSNFFSKLLGILIKLQGERKVGRLGSVVVIKCRK